MPNATRPNTTITNGFFGLGTDYHKATGTNSDGDKVSGFGKTKAEAEADYYSKVLDD